MLIGGDRPDISILDTINLFNEDSDCDCLNPIYGYLWASYIINNYYNYAPSDSIIGKLVRLLFTKNPATFEITPSKTVKLPTFIKDTIVTNIDKSYTYGIIIGLVYTKAFVKTSNEYLKLDLNIATAPNNTKTTEIPDIKIYIKSFNENILKELKIPKDITDDILKDIINVLLGLLWWSATDINGIKSYYTGLNYILPDDKKVIIPDPFNDNNYQFANNIMNILGEEQSINLFDTGSVYNEHVEKSKRTDKQNGFSDCGETTIRNLINIAVYDDKTKIFNIEHIESMGAIPSVLEYYTKYNTILKQSTKNARNDWGLIVSNLENVKYSNKNTDGYNFDIDSGLALDNKTTNLLCAIKQLFIKVKDWSDIHGLKVINEKINKGIGTLDIKKNKILYNLQLMDGHYYITSDINFKFSIDNADTKYLNKVHATYKYGILNDIKLVGKYDDTNLNWQYYIKNITSDTLYEIIKLYNVLINNEIHIDKINNFINILCMFNQFDGDVYDRSYIELNILKSATYKPEYKDKLVKYGIVFDDTNSCTYDNIIELKINAIILDKKVNLPQNLKKLTMGIHDYTNNIEGLQYIHNPLPKMPSSLEELHFSAVFNQELIPSSLPNSLKYIEFGTKFNNGGKPLQHGIFPKSLKYLKFGTYFTNMDKELLPGIFPNYIETLIIPGKISNDGNYSLKLGVLPLSLKSLTLPDAVGSVYGYEIYVNSINVYKKIPEVKPSFIHQIINKPDTDLINFIYY